MKSRTLVAAIALSTAPAPACADATQPSFRVEQQETPVRPEPPRTTHPEEARTAVTSHVEAAPPPRKAPIHLPRTDAADISTATITKSSTGFSSRVDQAMRPGVETTTTPDPKLEATVPNSGWGRFQVISKSQADGDGQPVDAYLNREQSALLSLKHNYGILVRIDLDNEIWFVIPDDLKPEPGMLKQMTLVLADARHSLTQERKRSRRATEKMISQRRRVQAPEDVSDVEPFDQDEFTQMARDLFDDPEIVEIDSAEFNLRLLEHLEQTPPLSEEKELASCVDITDLAKRISNLAKLEKIEEKLEKADQRRAQERNIASAENDRGHTASLIGKGHVSDQPAPPVFTLRDRLGDVQLETRA
jgi:hypothetical protein